MAPKKASKRQEKRERDSEEEGGSKKSAQTPKVQKDEPVATAEDVDLSGPAPV